MNLGGEKQRVFLPKLLEFFRKIGVRFNVTVVFFHEVLIVKS